MQNQHTGLTAREYNVLSYLKEATLDMFRAAGDKFGGSPTQYALAIDGLITPSSLDISFPIAKNKTDEVKTFVREQHEEMRNKLTSTFDGLFHEENWDTTELVATLSILKLQNLVTTSPHSFDYRITKEGLDRLSQAH